MTDDAHSVRVAASGISPAAAGAAWMLAGVKSMAPTTSPQTVVAALLVALISQEDDRAGLPTPAQGKLKKDGGDADGRAQGDRGWAQPARGAPPPW